MRFRNGEMDVAAALASVLLLEEVGAAVVSRTNSSQSPLSMVERLLMIKAMDLLDGMDLFILPGKGLFPVWKWVGNLVKG